MFSIVIEKAYPSPGLVAYWRQRRNVLTRCMYCGRAVDIEVHLRDVGWALTVNCCVRCGKRARKAGIVDVVTQWDKPR